MPLAAGSCLGPYEVLGPIGAGGMGEVYRARDARLDRDVAVKVLSPAFASDPDRRSRFEREAKAIAALSHPNIVAVYDTGRHGEQMFVVMELLQGETLRARLSSGALPVRKATDIAVQVARGLAAAHERGIVHRDLKPENVFLLEDGQVKILDFGLARTVSTGTGETQTADVVTDPGMAIGTVGYMAPEQVRGVDTDARADLFALGAVLYEMLSGRRAFQRPTAAETMTAVLREDPPDLAGDQRTDLPPALEHIVRHCLEKRAAERFQSAGDVAFALQTLSGTHPRTATAAQARPARFGLERLAWFGVLLAVAAVAAVGWWGRAQPPLPERRFEITTPPTASPSSFAISPDGRRLAFVATNGNRSMLWLRELGETAARPVAGTEDVLLPIWSSDGKAIAFTGGARLRRLDVASGAVQPLATSDASELAWNSSDDILYVPTAASPLFRIPASGGPATPATTLTPGMTRHTHPEFLPDGRRFVFSCEGTEEVRGIYLGSLDRPDVTRLASSSCCFLRFLAPDWLLFGSGGSIVGARIDLARGVLSDERTVIAADAGGLSVSASGLLAYRPGGGGLLQLIWFDRAGTVLEAWGEPDRTLVSPVVSPDGRRIAVERSGDIWIIDEHKSTRLTLSAVREGYANWSPDGSKVLFFSPRRAGRTSQYVKSAMDPHAAEDLLVEVEAPRILNGVTDWSRDGRFLLADVNDPKPSRAYPQDVWVVPLEGADFGSSMAGAVDLPEGRKAFPLVHSDFTERLARFSPDGRWIAYQSNESGRAEVYIRPFPGLRGQLQVSTAGGAQPRWRRDGRELYFMAPDAKLMAVEFEVFENREGHTVVDLGTPFALFQTRIRYGGTEQPFRNQYDVAPDGRFLINTVIDDSVPPIVVVENWAGR